MSKHGNSDILRKVGAAAAVAASVTLVAAACGDDTKDESSTTTGQESPSAAAPSGAVNGSYKDGEYTAVGKYTTPGGQQQVGITVTLANSAIAKISVDTSRAPKGSKTEEMQGKFKSGIDSQVVGKSIDSLDVDKVSGSSLTPKGFDDAIDQIKAQAKA